MDYIPQTGPCAARAKSAGGFREWQAGGGNGRGGGGMSTQLGVPREAGLV